VEIDIAHTCGKEDRSETPKGRASVDDCQPGSFSWEG
jgi:hypothetical protein